jgi:hypothetical protein
MRTIIPPALVHEARIPATLIVNSVSSLDHGAFQLITRLEPRARRARTKQILKQL